MDDVYSNSNGSQLPRPQGVPPMKKPPVKKKKHNNSKVIIALFVVMFLVLGSTFVVVYRMFSEVSIDTTRESNEYVTDADLFQNKNVFNVLVIGVDKRGNEKTYRSDSMILVSLDKNNKKIKLTSFMRDTWVPIPGKFDAKLNAACTYGGANLVIKTIEYNFNVKINKFVMIDFEMFQQIIDTVGGVDLPVTKNEAKEMYRYGKITVEPGDSVHMDGKTALLFSRIRKQDTDFKRSSRQRMVMTAVFDKLKKENPMSLLKIAKENLSKVQTDMDPTDLTKLAFNAAPYMRYDIEQAQIPKEGLFQDGRKNGSYIIDADMEKNRAYLYDFIYAADTDDTGTTTGK